jgi:hypothetical protein
MTALSEAYSYIVLRYVHDVVSGECVNVGLVLVAPGQRRLLARTRTTFGRIRQMFPDLHVTAFREAMGAIGRGADSVRQRLDAGDLGTGSPNALVCGRMILPDDDSSLQWSEMGAGLSSDIDQTFADLYRRFVTRHDRAAPRRKQDEDIWRPVRLGLQERGVEIPFERKIVTGKTDSIAFEHAWRNGRWHVYEPVSLDLSDAEGIREKARRWRGHLSAVEDGLREEVNLVLLLGRPGDPSLLGAYENGVAILQGASCAPRIVEENAIGHLLAQIEDDVRQHRSQAASARPTAPDSP